MWSPGRTPPHSPCWVPLSSPLSCITHCGLGARLEQLPQNPLLALERLRTLTSFGQRDFRRVPRGTVPGRFSWKNQVHSLTALSGLPPPTDPRGHPSLLSGCREVLSRPHCPQRDLRLPDSRNGPSHPSEARRRVISHEKSQPRPAPRGSVGWNRLTHRACRLLG